MFFRAVSTLAAAALGTLLAACGAAAGASTPAPAPTLPPPPPLSAEAQRALAEPAPTPPPAPAPQALPQSTPLLAADFDDGSLDGWLAQDFSEGPAGPASWQASGGALLQRGDALGLPDPGGAYLLAGDPGWGDYSVRAQAFAAQPTSLGLVGRTSEQGYYRARLEAGPAESLLVLEVVLDNQVRELARTLAPATTGRWLDLELSLRGQSLSVSLDGATLLSASDTTLHVGKIGLYATADALARFDNLLVVE